MPRKKRLVESNINDKELLWKLTDQLLYCICILGNNGSNYSLELEEEIMKAGLLVKRLRDSLNR